MEAEVPADRSRPADGQRDSEPARISLGIRSEATIVLLLTLLTSAFVFGPMIAGGFLFHDTLRAYSFFYDNLDSLNRFGQPAWWSPHVNYGTPTYFYALLGIPSAGKPAFVAIGAVAWLLGRLGIGLPFVLPIYFFYVAFLVPGLFMLGAWLLSRQIFSSGSARLYVLILAAFSPSVIANLSDPGLVENLAYTLICAAAYLRFLAAPTSRAFAVLAFTAVLVAISASHWVLVTAVPFLPLLAISTAAFSRRVRCVLRSVPLLHWMGAATAILVAASPSLVAYVLEKDHLERAGLGALEYDYASLKPGNPFEFLLASVPAVNFQWDSYQQAVGAPPPQIRLGPMRWGVAAGTNYLGVLALPLAFIGLSWGKRRLRLPLFAMLVSTVTVLLLFAWSPIFAPVLLAVQPLRTANHYGDLLFSSGGCILVILAAALGLDTIESQRALRRALLGLVVATGAIGLLLHVRWNELPQSLLGFHVGIVGSVAIVTLWGARSRLRRASRVFLVGILLLTLVDVATEAFWFVRFTVHGPPADLDAGLGHSIGNREPATTRIASTFVPRATLALLASEAPVGLLPPLATFCSARVLRGPATAEDVRLVTDSTTGAKPLPIAESLRADDELAPFLSANRTAICRATVKARGNYNELDVVVEAAQPVLLFVRDADSPYWRAEVDGREADVLPALGAFKAVAVPGGRHRVRLRFRPPGVAAALAAAYLVLLGLGAALFFASRRAPR